MTWYNTRDETVRFAYVTSLLLEGKQRHVLYSYTPKMLENSNGDREVESTASEV
jgi:hypothetical protein